MNKTQNKVILFDGRFLSLSHAGLGRYTLELLKALLPLDKAQKYILVVSPKTKFERDLADALYERENPVEIVEVDAPHYSFAEQYRFLRKILQLKPDLVHFPHFNHPILYKDQFVVTIHDLTLSQYAERGGVAKRAVYQKVIAHAVQKSRAIIVDSDFVKSEIVRDFSVVKSKIATIHIGVDEKFKKITNPLVLKRVEKYGLKNPYILSVGQWREHKNLIRLVEAFAKIKGSRGSKEKLDLVFVGREDSKYPKLREKIVELGLKNNVKFTGFVSDEDLPIIYNNAKVFAMPSLSEGFGLPGIEAQACGVPVASSNKTCLPEVYGNGAIYFDPENITDMAQKIKEVLLDNKLSSRLIRDAQENAKKFTWGTAAKKTLEVYREILYK